MGSRSTRGAGGCSHRGKLRIGSATPARDTVGDQPAHQGARDERWAGAGDPLATGARHRVRRDVAGGRPGRSRWSSTMQRGRSPMRPSRSCKRWRWPSTPTASRRGCRPPWRQSIHRSASTCGARTRREPRSSCVTAPSPPRSQRFRSAARLKSLPLGSIATGRATAEFARALRSPTADHREPGARTGGGLRSHRRAAGPLPAPPGKAAAASPASPRARIVRIRRRCPPRSGLGHGAGSADQ